MEPTLKDGDVVVVRKSDGIWQRWTRQWPKQQQQHIDHSTRDEVEENATIDTPSSSFDDDDGDGNGDYRWAIERGNVLEYEKDHCRSSPRTGWLRTPPVPTTGNIVVFQDPETYPSQWNIKRVIGLGGQVVCTE